MSRQTLGLNKSVKRKIRGGEVVFDPEERRNYLRGFSERKRQRRAFGLAMQKVKDRQARLEDRREHKKSELARIEEAERQKRSLQGEGIVPSVLDEESVGSVVTTTLASLSDDSDEEECIVQEKIAVDKRQRYAGDVEKFINQIKGSLPGKRKAHRCQARKGNHGAANMSGIGGAANLKIAKKALSKVQSKLMPPDSRQRRGKGRR